MMHCVVTIEGPPGSERAWLYAMIEREIRENAAPSSLLDLAVTIAIREGPPRKEPVALENSHRNSL